MIPGIGNQFPVVPNTGAGSSALGDNGRQNSNASSDSTSPNNNALSPIGNPSSDSTNASGQSSAVNNSAQTPAVAGAAFNPTNAIEQSRSSQPSRQDLVELEAVRVRFQLQRESQNSSGTREIQAFLDVADFERREELTNLVGLDIRV